MSSSNGTFPPENPSQSLSASSSDRRDSLSFNLSRSRSPTPSTASISKQTPSSLESRAPDTIDVVETAGSPASNSPEICGWPSDHIFETADGFPFLTSDMDGQHYKSWHHEPTSEGFLLHERDGLHDDADCETDLQYRRQHLRHLCAPYLPRIPPLRRLDPFGSMAGIDSEPYSFSTSTQGCEPPFFSTSATKRLLSQPEIEDRIFNELSAYEIALVCLATDHKLNNFQKKKWSDPIRDIFRNLDAVDLLINEGFSITVWGQDLSTIRSRALNVEGYLSQHNHSRPLFVSGSIIAPMHDGRKSILTQQKSRIDEVLTGLVGFDNNKVMMESDRTVFATFFVHRFHHIQDSKMLVSQLAYRRRSIMGTSFPREPQPVSDLWNPPIRQVVQYINIHQDRQPWLQKRKCGPSNVQLTTVQADTRHMHVIELMDEDVNHDLIAAIPIRPLLPGKYPDDRWASDDLIDEGISDRGTCYSEHSTPDEYGLSQGDYNHQLFLHAQEQSEEQCKARNDSEQAEVEPEDYPVVD